MTKVTGAGSGGPYCSSEVFGSGKDEACDGRGRRPLGRNLSVERHIDSLNV